MTTPNPHATAAREAAAARWLARRDRGMNPSEAQAFARWLEDPLNAEQWARAEGLWRQLGNLLTDSSEAGSPDR